MAQIRRIAIIALLIAIVGALTLAPHRHDPGQHEGNASCAVCQASHSLPLAKPALVLLPVREVVVFVAPPLEDPLIPRQIDCLAVAPGTSPPVPSCA